MSRIRTLVIAVVAIALFFSMNPSVRAATADLQLVPQAAVSDQTIVVVYLDVTAVSVDDLRAAVKTILGDQAPMLDEPLKQLQTLRDGFIAAGGRSLAIASAPIPHGPDESAFILTPAANADPAALETWFAAQLTDRQKRLAQWTVTDGRLMLTDKDSPLPTPSPARHALLMTQLSQINGPAKVLFVPTDQLRQQIAEGMKQAQQQGIPLPPQAMLSQQLVSAQWIALTVTAGEKPRLAMQIQMRDETQAQQFSQIWSGLTAMGMQMLAVQNANAGGQAPDMAAMMQALTMKQTGSLLELSLDGPTLAVLAKPLLPALIAARAAARQTMAASQMRQLTLGLIMYATDHDMQWPDSLDQARDYFSNADQFKKLMTHPVTGQYPGFIYTKPAQSMRKLAHPASVVILQEIGPDGQPQPSGIQAYADGHVAPTPAPGSVPVP